MNSTYPNSTITLKAGVATTPRDGCKTEVRLSCVGLFSEDLRITRNKLRSIIIFCKGCNKFMSKIGDMMNLYNKICVNLSRKITYIFGI